MHTAKRAAIKELVEQHVDSYTARCSGASLVQALCIRRHLLQLQALLCKKLKYMTTAIDLLRLSRLVVEQLPWSPSTVKHGSFLFAYFFGQMKTLALKSVHALGL